MYHLPSMAISEVETWIEKEESCFHRLVAEKDGRAIGYTQLLDYQNPRMHHSGGIELMVHPDFWRLGVGTALLEAILNSADNWLNLKRIDLEVNTDNPAAVALYHKFGFEIEGTHQYHAYGDGRMADSYFMARIKE